MLTDENKEMILNPIGKKPILDVPYRSDYKNVIRSRLYEYVEGFLKSKEVTTKFREINDELVAFYKAKCLEISDMENYWVDEASDAPQNENYGGRDDGSIIENIIAALAGFTFPVHLFFSQTARKRRIVEEEYNDFRENTVREFVRDELTKGIGNNLKQFINKVTQIY